MSDYLGASHSFSPHSLMKTSTDSTPEPFRATIESDKMVWPHQEGSSWKRHGGIIASNRGDVEGMTTSTATGVSNPHSEASDNIRDERRTIVANDLRTRQGPTRRYEVLPPTPSSFTNPTASRNQVVDISQRKDQPKQQSQPAREASMLAAAEQLISLSRGKQVSTPFKCDECHAFFRRRSYLGKHIRTVHLKEKPFKCDLCGRAFGHKSARTKHIRTIHMGLKPVKCTAPGCNLRFSERGNMKKHYSNMHASHFR